MCRQPHPKGGKASWICSSLKQDTTGFDANVSQDNLIACCVALVSLLEMIVFKVNKSQILVRLRSTGHIDTRGKPRLALSLLHPRLGPSSADLGELLNLNLTLNLCDCFTSLFSFLHCCCCSALSLSFWNFFDLGRLALMGILTVGFLLLFIVHNHFF